MTWATRSLRLKSDSINDRNTATAAAMSKVAPLGGEPPSRTRVLNRPFVRQKHRRKVLEHDIISLLPDRYRVGGWASPVVILYPAVLDSLRGSVSGDVSRSDNTPITSSPRRAFPARRRSCAPSVGIVDLVAARGVGGDVVPVEFGGPEIDVAGVMGRLSGSIMTLDTRLNRGGSFRVVGQPIIPLIAYRLRRKTRGDDDCPALIHHRHSDVRLRLSSSIATCRKRPLARQRETHRIDLP